LDYVVPPLKLDVKNFDDFRPPNLIPGDVFENLHLFSLSEISSTLTFHIPTHRIEHSAWSIRLTLNRESQGVRRNSKTKSPLPFEKPVKALLIPLIPHME
jgi:hypothetical protein